MKKTEPTIEYSVRSSYKKYYHHPSFRRTVIYYMANIDPSLSLCQLTLCQCTMGKVSTIFTWTTKRNVCCDKTKKIEMDLHVGHPFTINTGIIILGCMYLLLNRNMKFYSRSSNTVLHRTITPFFFIIQS